jgi:PIN domain nuclease of toxin-antitoxin system
MNLLLDSHIVLACVENERSILSAAMAAAIENDANRCFVSVATFWELSIKARQNKLPVVTQLEHWPAVIRSMGFTVVAITEPQVFADIGIEPDHKDPFDRLLLCVCAAQGMRLLTLDRALIEHPLAWRES